MKKFLQTNLHIILINLLFVVLLSCNKRKEEHKDEEYLKIINSKPLFSSVDSSRITLSGSWFFFNDKKEPLTDFVFIENSDSVFHYEMRVRNSKKQIVYFCENKNGKILKEFDAFEFEKINKENGSFLYNNYCKYCHTYNKDGISISMLKMSRITENELFKKISVGKTHDTLPKLSNNQILSIIKFIKKK